MLGSLVCTPGLSSRLPNNRVVFDRAPELVETSTLPSTVAVEGQFQLVIQVPVDAGEPLEALVVSPRSGEGGLPFDPTATVAYLGQPSTDLAPCPWPVLGV
ncbi:MAG: DUF2808 domain-containing protein [Leptolyngbyaceae cyanobacterium SM2_3_12]|nr:DUF2808 domain-containing protein [Leptolyngbyaceae cyanobacterium SM2_3_12]